MNGVSGHLTGLDADLADRLGSFRAHLQSQPLAAHTRRAYAGRVGGYLTWLAECDQLPDANRVTRSPTPTRGTTPSATTAAT